MRSQKDLAQNAIQILSMFYLEVAEDNLMRIALKRQSLKFELLAVYLQQQEFCQTCLGLYSVIHEIKDAEINMNN